MYTRPQLSPLCLQVDHSIVSASYPGSFISSILLVVAVYIHRNFAGGELINILNTFGFSDDISSASEHCIPKVTQIIISRNSHNCPVHAAESETGKLWISYVNNVQLPRLLSFAEFTGNWELHLFCTSQMIPLFHAAGHFVHVKSAHIYLHQMTHLQESMLHLPYEKFTEIRYFTIRKQAISKVEIS